MSENQPLVAVVTSRSLACMTVTVYIFFPICYIVLATLGGFLKVSIEEWASFAPVNLTLVTSLIISAASIGIILTFCGMCQKTLQFVQFMSILTPILLILQITAVVYGLIQVADRNNYLSKTINAEMKNEFLKYSSSDDVEKRFDVLQNEKDCCGVFGVKDYTELNQKIPISCCSVKDNMAKYCSSSSLAYQQGCASKVFDDIIKHIGILSYVALGLIILQILVGMCILKLLF